MSCAATRYGGDMSGDGAARAAWNVALLQDGLVRSCILSHSYLSCAAVPCVQV